MFVWKSIVQRENNTTSESDTLCNIRYFTILVLVKFHSFYLEKKSKSNWKWFSSDFILSIIQTILPKSSGKKDREREIEENVNLKFLDVYEVFFIKSRTHRKTLIINIHFKQANELLKSKKNAVFYYENSLSDGFYRNSQDFNIHLFTNNKHFQNASF